jgi:superkiller protein 3
MIGVPDSDLDDVATLLLKGRYDEAFGRLESVGVSEETAARVNYYKVLALCATKRLSDAEEIVRSAIETSPYYPLKHYALGCAYLNLSGRFDSSNPGKALPYLEVAARYLPEASGPRFYTGLALLELGRYEEAAAALIEVANSSPGFADAHLNLGLALSRLGRFDEALEALVAASTMRPDDPQIYMALGDVFFSLGDFERAADSYRSAFAGPGGALAAQYKLSLALLHLGDAAQAQAVAADLVSRYPRHFDGHVVLGRARLALGDAEGAIQAFESALWLRPGHFNIRLDLAAAHLAGFDPDRASEYLMEAFDIYAGDAHAYLLLASICELQGDIDGARAAAQKSVQIDPSNQSAWELYERLK